MAQYQRYHWLLFLLLCSSLSYRNLYFYFLHFCLVYSTASVKMPSGKVDSPRIEDNRDGTVRIQYDPREEGIHELVVLHNGNPIQGTCRCCCVIYILRRVVACEMRVYPNRDA